MKTFKTQYDRKDTGPYIFLRNLIRLMPSFGYTYTEKDSDVLLLSVRNEQKYRDKYRFKRIVTRCDGVYNNPERDVEIRERYFLADGLIFQSEFSKHWYYKVFGKREGVPSEIILNGSPFPYHKVGARESRVICCASWRGSKRPWLLKEMADRMPDIPFVIIGQFPEDSVTDNMILFGTVQHCDLPYMLMYGKVFFHTAFNDPCPNSVAEACVSGLYPVVSSCGGGSELVGEHGAVYIDDVKCEGRKHIPDMDMIEEQLREGLVKDSMVKRDDLSMRVCAERYAKFFGKVLEC